MTDHIQQLAPRHLQSTWGGDWEDFFTGFTYSLTIGCFVSANPVVCGGALVTQGVTLFAF